MDVDMWGVRKGKESFQFNRAGFEKFHCTPDDAVDFFNLAYEMDPRLSPAPCDSPGREAFIKELVEQPEYNDLHKRTNLDEMASDLAALSFAEQFDKLRGNGDGHSKPPDGPSGGSDKPGKPKPREGDSEGSEGNPDAKIGIPDMARMKAAAKALKDAAEKVEAADEMREAMGGMGAGGVGDYDPKRVAALFKQIRERPDLRRIFEKAGRFRRMARSLQWRKLEHGMDDTVGVRTDGNLSLALPHELSILGEEYLELDFLRRLTERQLMCREHVAPERVARGPIIVTVDESGSMNGEPVYQAKALALTMAWLAKQQQRWCSLVAFSGDSGERLLPLKPGQWNELKVMNWLEEFIGRGSNRDVPVVEMPRYYKELKAPKGKTDILFITDAYCMLKKKEVENFNAWKKEVKARVITLLIGNTDEKNPLAKVSDEMYFVPSLELNSQPVQRVLSI